MQPIDLPAKLEPVAIGRYEHLEPIAQQLGELFEEGHLLAGPSRVEQPEGTAVPGERAGHAEDRRDPDSAGHQQVLRTPHWSSKWLFGSERAPPCRAPAP